MNATSGSAGAVSAVLLSTLIRQCIPNGGLALPPAFRNGLFIGQLLASMGFTVYSFLLHNWVFASSKHRHFITAVVGQATYLHNKHRQTNRQ